MPTTEARFLIPADIRSAREGAFQPDWQVSSFAGETMGTTWSAKIAHPASGLDNSPPELITQNLDTVIQQMSPWESDSDLRRFQDADAGEWVPFRSHAFRVLQRALEIAAETDGCYDPTFAEAIDLLGFGPSRYSGYTYQSPEVSALFHKTGYAKIELDPQSSTVRQPGGIGLDLCSIAKGYAVDLVANTLEGAGIRNYYFEIGGEARGLGCKPSGEPWLISLERPRWFAENTNIPPTQIALCGIAAATSGNYVRYQIVDGQPIGHIVNPRQRRDSSSILYSVSVFSDTCIDADAYATALFLLGPDDGLALAEKKNLAALFLTSAGERLTSAALAMAE